MSMIDPNTSGPSADGLDWPAVGARIARRAAVADAGKTSLAADLRDLHRSGILDVLVRATGVDPDPLQAARMLRRLGRVSLPVGRIVEGHVNALKLIQLYGTAKQQTRAMAQATSGVIFGVWGADGDPAASFVADGPGSVTLQGRKRFCSGLGLVGQAILTGPCDQGEQLLLADVTDMQRGDPSAWQVSGMRATQSGDYDLTGLPAERLGQPGDYSREPHFEGGTWRYSALHAGALEALAEAVRRQVGSWSDPHQTHRLAHMTLLAETARLHVDAAATAVETAGKMDDAVAAETAVARALLAREAVEQSCLAGLALAERALGTQAFRSGTPVDLCRRDLAFFMRQANLDGKLTLASTILGRLTSEVGEQW